MKTLTYRISSILIILSWVMLCGLECHWPGDSDNGDNTDTSETTEYLSMNTEATVVTIDTTTMDVETDDSVILTCDLPTGVVLIVGDRIEITVTFESNESMWVITTTEFFQKI